MTVADDGAVEEHDADAVLARWPDPGVLFRAMVEGSVHMWSVVAADGTTLYANQACVDIVGWTPDELIGRNCIDLVHPDSQEIAITAFAEVAQREGGNTATAGGPVLLDLLHRDGHKVPVEIGSNPQLGNPVINGIILRCRLIASHALIEHFLELLTLTRDSDELLIPLVEALRMDIPACHVAMAYGWDGEAFHRVIRSGLPAPLAPEPGVPIAADARWTAAMAAHLSIRDETLDLVDPAMRAAAQREGYASLWVEPVLVPPDGELLALVVIWRDVEGAPWTSHELTIQRMSRLIGLAFERRENQRRLVHTATHDPLTDLPNRALFFQRLEQALHDRRSSNATGGLAVLYVDLDGFKPVNDQFGHALGDDVLAEIGARIADAVRPGDLVARLGGDEFGVVCSLVQNEADAGLVADRLLAACALPIKLGTEIVRVGASIGIAMATPGVTADELVQAADRAMYDAKQSGRGRWALAGG